MTLVHMAVQRPGTDGLVPSGGRAEWRPTARRVEGDAVVLPAPFSVDLTGGVADVLVAPSGPDWCWKVTEYVMPSTIRYVAVPDLPEIAYTDLIDVDPATLDPAAVPEAAWWAVAEGMVVSGAEAVEAAAEATAAKDDAVQVAAAIPAQASAAVAGEVVAQVNPKVTAAAGSATASAGSATQAVQAKVAAEAARDRAEAVPTTSDGIMTSVAADPETEFAGVLKSTYASHFAGDNTTTVAQINTWLADRSTLGIKRLVGTMTINAPIVIPSNTYLDASGATVTLAPGSDCNIIRNAAFTSLTGERDKKITLIGGTWNRGANGGLKMNLHSLMFQRVDGLIIRDTAINSTSGKYSIYVYACKGFEVTGTTFNCSSDGVHISGASSQGYVADVFGSTGDDTVAITSNDYADYVNGDLGDVTDVVIERVYSTTTANCVKVLAGSVAGVAQEVRRITVRNITGTAAQAAVHCGGDPFQANTAGGRTVDVTIDGVVNKGAGHGVVTFHSTYEGLRIRNVSSPTGVSKYALNIGAGTVANDITVESSQWETAAGTSAINFVPSAPYPSVTNLRVEKCKFKVATKTGALITTNSASVTLGNLYVSNLLADRCAWALGDFYTNTKLFVNVLKGADISGWINVRAGGVIDFQAATGMSANVANLSTSGTVYSNSIDLSVDVSKLTQRSGDMALNTNSGLACGYGRVVTQGTSWKNLATGAVYTP